jgi:peroxiredoxin
MNKIRLAAILAATLTCTAFAVQVGTPAPDFSGTDTHGKTEQLSAYKGKYVVLEWTNADCPYAHAQYASGNMQSLQKQWTAKGVVWLSIISSAPDHQGYKTASEENAYLVAEKASPTAVLLDPTGKLGHEFEAKTTPHMFIIDPSGKLIYAGAIDDHPTSNPAEIKNSKNYVTEALTAAMAGKPVPVAYTRSYGCSVKYAGEGE